MQPSKHNIIGQIRNTSAYYIVNLLSGHADILTEEEAGALQQNRVGHPEEMISKGYLVDPVAEQSAFNAAYLDFLDEQEEEEVQLFFVPTYQCNFHCSYCYQSAYPAPRPGLTKEVIDAFFDYIKARWSHRKTYITLFGGEPLLSRASHQELITYFMGKAHAYGQEVSIVTNGYSLAQYLPILTSCRIREIQITLDGMESTHNQRRPLKGGQGTFKQLVAAIDAALKYGLPVNLRVVLDKENILELPKLAALAKNKGWTRHELFKTQLGRNYELHACQEKQALLYSRLELYEDIFLLMQKHPELYAFHKPAFSISKFLFENGQLPTALFDACPGTKTEWAFDNTGHIYACTATVGKPGEELGTFFPAAVIDAAAVGNWQNRDVLSIGQCKDCNLQLACGGGCAAVAKNNTGDHHSPDCRPVQELIGLGIGLYKDVDD